MTTPVAIVGSSSQHVQVTDIGELVVGDYQYSTFAHNELDSTNTAYNFWPPRSGEQFVITAMLYSADQQVSNTTGATVIIYEASAADSTTVDTVVHQDDMVKNDRVAVSGLRIKIGEGKYLNAKTDDDDIHMSIAGYYIPVIN